VTAGGGNWKNILGGQGAGAYVMDGFLNTLPSLMMIGPGLQPGRTMGAGGGQGLTFTTRLADGPEGSTTGGNLLTFDGNWTTKGPGTAPGATTSGVGAGTDKLAVTVGVGPRFALGLGKPEG